MAKVNVGVEEITLTGDRGGEVESICLTCERCDHKVEVFGRSERSEKRGLMMLREQCPNGEENFYMVEK
jgi:hypothetical protein